MIRQDASQRKTLCLDFGNTRLKGALFSGSEFMTALEIPDGSEATIDRLLEQHRPTHAILSSVVEHSPGLEQLLAAKTAFHKLNHTSRLPITTPVGKPATIGADRLAMVVAANSLYPESNNLVIGLGTAITYNFVNRSAEFLGGGISPGMEMRFKALHTFTAKLPLVEKHWNFPLVGYDTRTNILSGVIFGMAKEIDGMIDLYREKYGNLNVLLTGGDSVYFSHHLKNRIFADLQLIFKGLYTISVFNNG